MYSIYKREYNSERRRKLLANTPLSNKIKSIRENITPRGDGNLINIPLLKILLNKREYNSERRRKLNKYTTIKNIIK